MPKSSTFIISVAAAAYGLVFGLFLPGFVTYSVLFVRRNGRSFKTAWRLFGRFFLAFLSVGFFGLLMLGVIKLAGGSEQELVENPFYMIGFGAGFFGFIVALLIGKKRGRRQLATNP